MPLYDYVCENEKCKKYQMVVEVDKKITDETPELCEECKSEMRRLISRSKFMLKGDGWHAGGFWW